MNWLKNFMAGRYGPDQLCVALMLLGMLFSVLANFRGWGWLLLLSYAAMVWALARLLSRNREKRWAENQTFLRLFAPFTSAARGFVTRVSQSRQYHFYTCPKCGQRLRVPRGKGKLEITCPKCREAFTKKT